MGLGIRYIDKRILQLIGEIYNCTLFNLWDIMLVAKDNQIGKRTG